MQHRSDPDSPFDPSDARQLRLQAALYYCKREDDHGLGSRLGVEQQLITDLYGRGVTYRCGQPNEAANSDVGWSLPGMCGSDRDEIIDDRIAYVLARRPAHTVQDAAA